MVRGWIVLAATVWSAVVGAAATDGACAASDADVVADGGGKLYWVLNYPNKIQRANLDGSGLEDIVEGLEHPQALAIDEARGKLYWADSGQLVDSLRRANLDGSDVEVVLENVASWGLAVDSASEKLYWTDLSAGTISRSNFDGTEAETLISDGLVEPSGLALDVAGGYLYWSDFGAGKVQRAALANLAAIQDVATNLSHPTGVALDRAGGRVYWADSGAFKIQSAPLTGGDVEDVWSEGVKDPHGLVVDADGTYLYFTTIGTVYEGRKQPSSSALSGGRIQRLRLRDAAAGAPPTPEDVGRVGRARPVALAIVDARRASCSQTGVRRLRVGDSVLLRVGLAAGDDALKGPLRPGDVGRIAADDKSDQPFMVSVGGQDWWYREDALTLHSPR